jgi:Asp-tRNA(Asn)/Glu-tRNA(Gln) amidotransferase B subunit
VLAPFAPPPPVDANQLVERAGDAARRMTGRVPDTLLRWAMGEVMPRLLGRADPRDVRRRLEERLLGVGAGAGQ